MKHRLYFAAIGLLAVALLATACGSPELAVHPTTVPIINTRAAAPGASTAVAPPTALRTSVATIIPATAVPTPTPTAVPTTRAPISEATTVSTACANRATFVADVTVKDNTTMTAGQTFVKTWRIRNAGTCTWTTGYQLVFERGEAMTMATATAVPMTAPGATVNLTVRLTAPTAEGTHSGIWRLRAPDRLFFGDNVSAVIRVAGAVAAAPALVQANTDDPAKALPIDGRSHSVTANSAIWYRFDYVVGNDGRRPSTTITLSNGTQSGLRFQIYAPENITDWWNQPPTGLGGPISLDCTNGEVAGGGCPSSYLLWTGTFGATGTYYVRVINDTSAPANYVLTIQ